MKFLVLIATLFLPLTAFSHARLKPSPGVLPRSNSAGIKSGPCGPAPRSLNPPTVQGGTDLLVTWEETIEHPGRYEIYFSEKNDENFVLLATVADVQGGMLPHQYSALVKIPNVNCSACTLQMIQVMTENPLNPSLYFSCADLKVVATGAGNGPPPEPTPVCKP